MCWLSQYTPLSNGAYYVKHLYSVERYTLLCKATPSKFTDVKGQSEFSPQISISILKTSETNKNLIKYCYCKGCDKKNQTVFKIIINNMDLIQSKESVNIQKKLFLPTHRPKIG